MGNENVPRLDAEETRDVPSQSEVGGGGRSPTRPITPVPTGVGDGADGGVRLLGRGGATEANFFGWL